VKAQEDVMAKAPITPVDAEIEAELEKQKEIHEEGDANESADQKVPGSDEIPSKPGEEAQRQAS
jgi:hypothetical protein